MKSIRVVILIAMILLSSGCSQPPQPASLDRQTEEYVLSHTGGLLYAYDNNIDLSDICLSAPLSVQNSEFDRETVFLVSANKEVIGTLFVYEKDSQYGSCFSENYADILLKLRNSTDRKYSIVLYKEEGALKAKAGSYFWNFETAQGKIADDRDTESSEHFPLDYLKLPEQNTKDSVRYRNWQTFYTLSGGNGSCAIICLYNIYRNLGYADFEDYNSFKDHVALTLDSDLSPETFSGYVGYDDILAFLKKDGYDFSAEAEGSPDPSRAYDTLSQSSQYVLMLNSIDADPNGSIHVTALAGITKAGDDMIFTVFDPHGAKEGILTLYASFPVFSTKGKTYRWDKGFFDQIHK